MTSTTPRTRSALAAAALMSALVVVLALLAPSATVAQEGPDATAQSLAVSQATFADGAPAVVVARDDVPADALSAGFVQAAVDGPLLLTETGALEADVADEITRLGAGSATILGGPAAISQDVQDQLVQLGLTVNRIEGPTRSGTAEAAARDLAPQATTAVLARAYPAGDDATTVFADSIAGGRLAHAMDMPVFLTQTAAVDQTTLDELAASTLQSVILLGGTAAISEDAADQVRGLGIEVTRLSGDTRAGTAALVAEQLLAGGGITRAVLVDGYVADGWASGFAAASYADAVVLLVDGDTVPAETDAVLSANPDLQVVCAPNATADACTS